jgi:hypothetical protein
MVPSYQCQEDTAGPNQAKPGPAVEQNGSDLEIYPKLLPMASNWDWVIQVIPSILPAGLVAECAGEAAAD